ncbi:MAG: hypothetical protein IJL66_06300 [Lachnospiraceae bacterium]|nr:hypothetical protein [Lachnospiraceae bacterium]
MSGKHLRTWPAAVLALVLAIYLASAPVPAAAFAAPASAVSAGVSAEDVWIFPGSYALGRFLPAPAAQTLASDPAVTRLTGNYGQTEARRMLSLINSFRAGQISTEGQKIDPCGSGRYAWQWNSDDATTTTFAPNSLSTLTYDYGLEKIAMQRAAEIAVSFSHTRPDGSNWYELEIDGVSSNGENIACGYYAFETQESVFEAWREDDDDYSGQGHRRNMLHEVFDAVGVGFFSVGDRHYWVQEFGVCNSGKPATAPNDSAASVLVDFDRAAFPDVVPLEAPVITKQPKNVTAPLGSTALFTVEADGPDLTYQWQYSRDGVFWTNSPAKGSKTASLEIPVTDNRNGLRYRCLIMNRAGFAVSDTAKLTVQK